jgi:hypothetical protein
MTGFAPAGASDGSRSRRGRVAFVGAAQREQRLGGLAVPRGAGELVDGVAIPIETEPLHAGENGVDRFLRGALPVRVLDPQQHLAAVMARKQPVEERGARTADVEKAGRRRREARDDGFGHLTRRTWIEAAARVA